MAEAAVKVVGPRRERASRRRQRQRLIDATISALHAYGPSRTTVDKVVSIAEMSPGIVTFYFESKAEMLVAALRHLADEFEEQVLKRVIPLKAEPVQALRTLVDLYLDPEIASPRKVSVWYAFWGEATSRQEYMDICGAKDTAFSAIVLELVTKVVAIEGEAHLDADAIALGLLGCLEIQWQEIAFQPDVQTDRRPAKRRCLSYLHSVFPRSFGAVAKITSTGPMAYGTPPIPGWAYADTSQFARERSSLFLPSWQVVGVESALPKGTGAYMSFDLLGERGLVVRGEDGILRGFHDVCLNRPHTLTHAPSGSFDGKITCGVDGWSYDYSGALTGPIVASDGVSLHPIEIAAQAGLLFARSAETGHVAAGDWSRTLATLCGEDGVFAAATMSEIEIAADWKTVIGILLDRFAGHDLTRSDGEPQWLGVPRASGSGTMEWVCLFPGLFMERCDSGLSVTQVIPTGPGTSRLIGVQATGGVSPEMLDDMQSTQAGYLSSAYRPAAILAPGTPAEYFARWYHGQFPDLSPSIL